MKKLWICVFAIALCAFGCEGKSDGDSAKSEKEEKEETPKEGEGEGGEAEKEAANLKPIGELFGDKVGLVGACVGAEIGKPLEDVKKAMNNDELFEYSGVSSYEYEGTDESRFQSVGFRISKGAELGDIAKACNVDFSLKDVDVPAEIDKAWPGATVAGHFNLSQTQEDGTKKRVETRYWFVPEQNLRVSFWDGSMMEAVMRSYNLELEYYLPMEGFLAGEGTVLSFEGDTPVLGQNIEALTAKYGEQFSKGSGIVLAPVDWNAERTQIMFTWGDDKETAVGYRISFDIKYYDGAKDFVLAALEKRFGKPTQDAADETVWVYPVEGDVPVKAKVDTEYLILTVGNYRGW